MSNSRIFFVLVQSWSIQNAPISDLFISTLVFTKVMYLPLPTTMSACMASFYTAISTCMASFYMSPLQ